MQQHVRRPSHSPSRQLQPTDSRPLLPTEVNAKISTGAFVAAERSLSQPAKVATVAISTTHVVTTQPAGRVLTPRPRRLLTPRPQVATAPAIPASLGRLA